MKDNKKAFTLIELLVVVAIIGVLASVGIVSFNSFTESARNATVKANEKIAASFIQNTLMKCEFEWRVVVETHGWIDCKTQQHFITITPVNEVFLRYLLPKFGKNPFNNSLNAVVVSGGSQPNGTLALDYGQPNQCDGRRWCLRLITYLSNYPDGRNIMLFYFPHWN